MGESGDREVVPDVLADRYASTAMLALWSPRTKVVLEREFWIEVMRAQRDLGLPIPSEAIAAYEAVRHNVDLDRIRARERTTRHDVKARIDEFCYLAGQEHIHKGLTSRDLTENVEQLQSLRAMRLVQKKYVACIGRLAERVMQCRALVLSGRTHNVPAQATTAGKRLAMFGTEMLQAAATLNALLARYPLRGLKGPVGTQLDLLTLFDGDHAKVQALEAGIAERLGFCHILQAVGQVYPRSLDFEVVSVLLQLAAGPSSFAHTLRLMAGHELATEGFRSGQVGSSAMPHKVNSRSCERISGLKSVLAGYVTMCSESAGDQWNEGDVSCSVVRRVALPGSFLALDGLLETFATVLAEFRISESAVAIEIQRIAPFLATTTVLMEAVKAGAGREQAHEIIKEHSLAEADAIRRGEPSRLLDRLAGDVRLGLSRGALERALALDERYVGAAVRQADAFVEAAQGMVRATPGAEAYQPEEIL
jgi:adenylosuccinate lyase